MPRITPKDFIRAKATSKSLLSLLPVCRDLASARAEFRWLKEHAINVSQQAHVNTHRVLNDYVARRAQGEPLQYILGSEYFGDLEIKCRTGVLIPRPETAVSISHLVKLLRSKDLKKDEPSKLPSPLRVLDLCTGTGCIPLLFHREYFADGRKNASNLELVGVDISTQALSLARENLIHQIAQQASSRTGNVQRTRSLHSIGFVQADVLSAEESGSDDRLMSLLEALERLHSEPTFDILISNPPYISPKGFMQTTTRPVRQYEPRLALVPPSQDTDLDEAVGDLFYPKLLDVAEQVKAKIFLFEVADMDQARRVASMASNRGIWDSIEIWRDEPEVNEVEETTLNDQTIKIRGSGHGRSVFAYRGPAQDWLKS